MPTLPSSLTPEVLFSISSWFTSSNSTLPATENFVECLVGHIGQPFASSTLNAQSWLILRALKCVLSAKRDCLPSVALGPVGTAANAGTLDCKADPLSILRRDMISQSSSVFSYDRSWTFRWKFLLDFLLVNCIFRSHFVLMTYAHLHMNTATDGDLSTVNKNINSDILHTKVSSSPPVIIAIVSKHVVLCWVYIFWLPQLWHVTVLLLCHRSRSKNSATGTMRWFEALHFRLISDIMDTQFVL